MSAVQFASDRAFFLAPVGGVSQLFQVSRATGSVTRAFKPAGDGDTEANISLAEKLRRERSRQTSVGVTTYTIVPGDRGVVFVQDGSLLWLPLGAAHPVVCVDKAASGADGPVLDAAPSPDGTAVAWVQDSELYVAQLRERAVPVQVTHGSRGVAGLSHATADYLAAEELDRSEGFWWAPPGSSSSHCIAFQATDERHVPAFTITHGGAAAPDSTAAEEHRYPFAGGLNPYVRLGVVDVSAALAHSGAATTAAAAAAAAAGDAALAVSPPPPPPPPAVIQLDLSGGIRSDGAIGGTGGYLARVSWVEAGSSSVEGSGAHSAAAAVCVQLLNRRQDVVDVVLFPGCCMPHEPAAVAPSQPRLQRGYLLLRDTADDPALGWINTHDCLRFVPPAALARLPPARLVLARSGGCADDTTVQEGVVCFLWASERPSGFQHLQLFAFQWPAATPDAAGAPAVAYCGIPRSSRGLPAPATAGADSGPVLVQQQERQQQQLAWRVGATTRGRGWIVEAVCGIFASLPSVHNPPPATAVGAEEESEEAAAAAGSARAAAAAAAARGAGGGGAPGPWVLFQGTADSCLEKHLYASPLLLPTPLGSRDGGEDAAGTGDSRRHTLRLTSGAGMHSCVVSPDCSWFLDALSSLHTPPSLAAYSLALGPAEADAEPASYVPSTNALAAALLCSPADGGAGEKGGAAGATEAPGIVGSLVWFRGAAYDSEHPSDDFAARFSRVRGGGGGWRVSRWLKALCHGALPPALEDLPVPAPFACTPASYPPAIASLRAWAVAAARGEGGGVTHLELASFLGGGGEGGGAAERQRPQQQLAEPNPAAVADTGALPTASPRPAAAATLAASPLLAPLIVRLPVAGAAAQGGGPEGEEGEPGSASLETETDADADASHMYAALYLPTAAAGSSFSCTAPPFPTVVHVYGGPHVQRCKADWSLVADPRSQSLRAAGFLVVVLDNRGSFRRGAAWERALSRRLGSVEVEDQAAAVRWLAATGLADARRVGAVGWSYGGYMSLLLLCKEHELFRAAVAGAPVTDWAGYDTAYTERYMGRPKPFPLAAAGENDGSGGGGNDDDDLQPAAYAASSVLAHVARLDPSRSRLLLVHGLIDENVHARHSFRLLGALAAAGAGGSGGGAPADACDLLLLPEERHCVRGPAAKALLERRISRFFSDTLLRGTA